MLIHGLVVASWRRSSVTQVGGLRVERGVGGERGVPERGRGEGAGGGRWRPARPGRRRRRGTDRVAGATGAATPTGRGRGGGRGDGRRRASGAALPADLHRADAAARAAEAHGALGRDAGLRRGAAPAVDAQADPAGRRVERHLDGAPAAAGARAATSVRPDAVRSVTRRAPRVTPSRLVREAGDALLAAGAPRADLDPHPGGRGERAVGGAGGRGGLPEAPVGPHTAAAAVDGKRMAATSAASSRRRGIGSGSRPEPGPAHGLPRTVDG